MELINNLTKLNYFNIPNDFTGKVLVIKNNTKSANISIIIDGKEKIKEDNIYAKAPSVSCYEVIQLYDTGPPRQTGITFCVDDSGYNPYTNQTSYTYHGGGGVETTPDDVQIINGLTGKALCIYNLLNSSSSDFADDIKKFDGEFPVSHLKLTINNNLEPYVYGITLPPINYVTEVQISNTALETLSDLGTATVFAHEIIHAEIFRKMLSAAQRGTLNSKTPNEQITLVNSLKDNFPGLYDYYEKRYNPTWNHEMMANHYRGTIADIIQKFDNNHLPRSTYEAVAWVGLGKHGKDTTTIAWDNLKPEEKKVIEELIRDNFYNGPSNCN
ncbi:hypothetical protein [Flavobacterium degerlachei]|uniref:Uncharacterized protein n=1 Tax=Flavobacterium degerlachei TaxID=229203 RepID=A0A1H2QNQ3_9FLAO|nr:hypothetical protein [Flavobacterium degerlachei]SDW08837.1 hypothetical protein SAMN05444338_101231 [Flavobacterium degerlachei]